MRRSDNRGASDDACATRYRAPPAVARYRRAQRCAQASCRPSAEPPFRPEPPCGPSRCWSAQLGWTPTTRDRFPPSASRRRLRSARSSTTESRTPRALSARCGLPDDRRPPPPVSPCSSSTVAKRSTARLNRMWPSVSAATGASSSAAWRCSSATLGSAFFTEMAPPRRCAGSGRGTPAGRSSSLWGRAAGRPSMRWACRATGSSAMRATTSSSVSLAASSTATAPERVDAADVVGEVVATPGCSCSIRLGGATRNCRRFDTRCSPDGSSSAICTTYRPGSSIMNPPRVTDASMLSYRASPGASATGRRVVALRRVRHSHGRPRGPRA